MAEEGHPWTPGKGARRTKEGDSGPGGRSGMRSDRRWPDSTEVSCRHPELRLQQGSQRWLLGIYTFSSSKQICKTSTTTPILQVRKLRLRAKTCLAQGSRAQDPTPQVTWVVAAAPRGAPPPPRALVQGGVPVAEPLALECVRRQVADLQAGEFTHEVSE